MLMNLREAPKPMRSVKGDFLSMPFTLRVSGRLIPVMAIRETYGSMLGGSSRSSWSGLELDSGAIL